jgi:hypothetical protein
VPRASPRPRTGRPRVPGGPWAEPESALSVPATLIRALDWPLAGPCPWGALRPLPPGGSWAVPPAITGARCPLPRLGSCPAPGPHQLRIPEPPANHGHQASHSPQWAPGFGRRPRGDLAREPRCPLGQQAHSPVSSPTVGPPSQAPQPPGPPAESQPPRLSRKGIKESPSARGGSRTGTFGGGARNGQALGSSRGAYRVAGEGSLGGAVKHPAITNGDDGSGRGHARCR